MQYQRFLILFLLALISFNSSAKKPIKIGVTWNVTVSGFFSPEIEEIIVLKILDNSPAKKAGLKVGHKVLSIEGCKIPGCSASQTKEYLKADTGSQLHFVIENKKGEIENLLLTVG